MSALFRTIHLVFRPLTAFAQWASTRALILTFQSGVLQRLPQSWLRSLKLYLLRTGGVPHPSFNRSVFQRLQLCQPTANKPTGHTHRESANDRNLATPAASHFASIVGLKPYHYQGGAAPLRAGATYSLIYLWVKDLLIPAATPVVPENALIVRTDVVEHEDDFREKLLEPRVHWIYTTIPETAGANTPELAFYFKDNGELHCDIRGNAKYEHFLWDWAHDHITVTSNSPLRTTSYLVDTKKSTPHHTTVLLTPLGSWTGVAALIARELASDKLQRFNPIVRGAEHTWAVVNTYREDGVHTSIARTGQYLAATLPKHVLEAQIHKNEMTGKISTSEIKRATELTDTQVNLLTNFLRDRAALTTRVATTYAPDIKFQKIAIQEYTQTDNHAVQDFMKPLLVGACYNPEITNEVINRTCATRVEGLARDVPRTTFLMQTMAEFVGFFSPDLPLQPADEAAVYERQCSPNQKQILDAGYNTSFFNRVVQSFIKKEALSKTNEPRLITTFGPHVKALYSRYMIAIAEHAATQRWYAFGKKPRELAERVATICTPAGSVVQTDATRLDAHINEVLRDLEKMLIVGCLHHSHHAEALALHEAQYNNKGYVHTPKTCGGDSVTYQQLTTRGSGSAETSVFNTITMAFLFYLAFRLTHDGTAMPPQQAWQALGIYGGDDGLTADMTSERLLRAAAMVGLTMKCEPTKRGGRVTFLARIFSPGVWHGQTDSVTDIRRAMGKFHVTPKLDVDPDVKLHQKAFSLYLTDSKTPVLGDLAATVVRLAGDAPEDPEKLRSWWAQYSTEDQWPQDDMEWALGILAEDLPEIDLVSYRARLSTCKNLAEVRDLEPLAFVEPATDNAVVDGEDNDPKTLPPTTQRKDPKGKGKEKLTGKPAGKRERNTPAKRATAKGANRAPKAAL